MKLTTVLSIGALVLALPLFASASTTDWADSVVEFNQGLKNDLSAVNLDRSDPNQALGSNDGLFVSLGYEGDLTLGFPIKGKGTLMIKTYEVTNSDYPLEKAEVYVSPDGVNWTHVGTADNSSGEGDGTTEISVMQDICVQYVKLIDSTDPNLHNNDSDGFDLDAVSFTYDEVCVIDECPECSEAENNDKVKNVNEATVINEIVISANTGGNYAGGSSGGDGGDGGDIKNYDDGDVEDSTTGLGGDGGNGSTGGTVISGNIDMSLNMQNRVNHNLVEIDRCACIDDENNGDIRVRNINRAMVANSTLVMADTGNNYADGSYGGEGGDGGYISNQADGDVEDSMTSSGGLGGDAAAGGLVQTGNTTIVADWIERINENITRIRR